MTPLGWLYRLQEVDFYVQVLFLPSLSLFSFFSFHFLNLNLTSRLARSRAVDWVLSSRGLGGDWWGTSRLARGGGRLVALKLKLGQLHVETSRLVGASIRPAPSSWKSLGSCGWLVDRRSLESPRKREIKEQNSNFTPIYLASFLMDFSKTKGQNGLFVLGYKCHAPKLSMRLARQKRKHPATVSLTYAYATQSIRYTTI